MASTTKIMTALLAIELGRQAAVYRVSHAAATVIGTRMGLRQGERVPLHDLLYGLLLPSGNDAAIAIAEGIAGSQAAFVRLMNAKARALGMWNTHYVTPHGLDRPGHYSSARDLVIVARAAMQLPLFRTIVGTRRVVIPPTATHHRYILPNINEFLAWYPGANGVKPGWTPRAGTCLVESVTRFGRHLLGVVLDAPYQVTAVTDIRDLFNYGFGDYQWVTSRLYPDTPDLELAAGVPTAPALYFPVSGHTVGGAFLTYFLSHGGIAALGYPLTEEFAEDGQWVQYFSGARLVLDSRTQTGAPTPLGLLDVPHHKLLHAIAAVPNTSWRTYYPQTGHTVTWSFRLYFLAHGGVRTFGYPVTEKVTVAGQLVQFFTNAEFIWRRTRRTSGYVVVAPLGAQLLDRLTAPLATARASGGQS
jgi:hypothetical protein